MCAHAGGRVLSYATVGGGNGNSARGQYSSVAGGRFNIAAALINYATVSGGYENTASGFGSFVGGGGARTSDNTGGNVASGAWSAVVGGFNNQASGR